MLCLRESRPLVFLLILQIAFARHTHTQCRIDHARKAEKLITLIAIPAYDPTIKVNIILIISCTMDVYVIKACFGSLA